MGSLSNLSPAYTTYGNGNTQVGGMHSQQSSLGGNGNHVYAASAPGTPYFSPANIGNPYESGSRLSPPRSMGYQSGTVTPAYGPGSGLGLSGRKGSQSAESSGSSAESGMGRI